MPRLRPAAPVAALAALLALLALAPAAGAVRLSGEEGPDRTPATGRVLVSLDAPRGKAAVAGAARRVLARTGARQVGAAIPEIAHVTVRPPAGLTARALLARLRRDPAVRAASLERRATFRELPDDPALAQPDPNDPSRRLQWQAERLRLPRAWDLTDGAGALVAVIDSGVDGGHPDFGGQVVEALDRDSSGTAGPLVDENGHGTHVSGLACAGTDNGIGIAGAGHDCGLLVIKSDLTDQSVMDSIMAAARRDADVISMSFGTEGDTPPPQGIVDAVRFAAASGSILVAAAKNEPEEEQGYPANLLQPTGTGPDLASNRGLVVTASDARDDRAFFAGRGSQVSVAAPGFHGAQGPDGLFGLFPGQRADIEEPTLVPEPSLGCQCRTSLRGDQRYAYLAGTSMATPQVAGIVALAAELNPDLRADEIVRLVKETARGTAWEPELGWGIADAGALVDRVRRVDRRAPRSRARAARRVRSSRVRVRVAVSDEVPGLVAAGVRRVELWGGSGGRPPRRLTRSATRRAFTVRVRPGRRYRFYSVAVDRAGNREDAPARADATVRTLRPRR